ncbi:GIY-YIG catalytic domain-containing protein [Staphylococcus aureus]|uniref:GIY-YIG catalytic domain-containing protein n=1 Tax=Staphylococcus aureus TaxID=1280 RepID=A0A380DL84_STAAU|nr:GIY-YIG catalytic domain-containing protein [Staphylococcus aureus]
MDSHFVYIVKCSDGSLYTGYAKTLMHVLKNITEVKEPNIRK